MILHRKVNEGEFYFTASTGWTHSWEKYFGMSQLIISEGGLSLDSELFVKFGKEHQSFIKTGDF